MTEQHTSDGPIGPDSVCAEGCPACHKPLRTMMMREAFNIRKDVKGLQLVERSAANLAMLGLIVELLIDIRVLLIADKHS